jgi:serine-type D-Ala-D-Ala carboxypeptidase/endopeptidase (penicillin-binding protein 4)
MELIPNMQPRSQYLPRAGQRFCWLTAGFLLWAIGPNCVAAEKPLASRIDEIINAPDYRLAHWGILIVDMAEGKPVYEHDADKLLAPASVTKLYSVAAALEAFGANHRIETPVYRRGKVQAGGILEGDLILVASGDLTMGGRTDSENRIAFTDSDHIYANGGTNGSLTSLNPLAGIEHLARQVANNGISRIQGDVFIDDRLFDKAAGTGSGPSKLTPMVINDNLIDVVITPTKTGELATIEWRPKTQAFQVDAQVVTVATNKPLRVELNLISSDRVMVRGEIPAGHSPLLRVVEVDDPASFARSLFIEALGRAGVAVAASPLTRNNSDRLPASESYTADQRVAVLISPPFSEEAKLILKVSHNLHASTLPLLLAAKHGRRTLADGLQFQREFLVRVGIDVNTISFGGAAGGARADMVTPRATVALLRAMSKRPDFSVYEKAQPVIGLDGTLARVVDEKSPIRGKVRAKTGTLVYDDVMNDRSLLISRALAGYMTTAKGKSLSVAIFVNNVPLKPPLGSSSVMRTIAKICEEAYSD